MDCRELSFLDRQFDVIIEKATIEVFFTSESSLWSVSEATIENVRKMADEITRVLKPSTGKFFSISFTAPHFRKELFHKMFSNDTDLRPRMNVIDVYQLGDHFHYYMYHLSNDPNSTPVHIFTYEPPKVTKMQHSHPDNEHDQDCDLFLYSISP